MQGSLGRRRSLRRVGLEQKFDELFGCHETKMSFKIREEKSMKTGQNSGTTKKSNEHSSLGLTRRKDERIIEHQYYSSMSRIQSRINAPLPVPRMKLDSPSDRLLHELFLVVRSERAVPAQQDIGDDTERPKITWFAVADVGQHFGSGGEQRMGGQ